MIVMKMVRLALRPLIDPNYDPRFFKYFVIIFFSSSIFVCIASAFQIAENVDLTEVMQPTFVIMTFLLGYVILICFVRNKTNISGIFDSLQRIVDESQYLAVHFRFFVKHFVLF